MGERHARLGVGVRTPTVAEMKRPEPENEVRRVCGMLNGDEQPCREESRDRGNRAPWKAVCSQVLIRGNLADGWTQAGTDASSGTSREALHDDSLTTPSKEHLNGGKCDSHLFGQIHSEKFIFALLDRGP